MLKVTTALLCLFFASLDELVVMQYAALKNSFVELDHDCRGNAGGTQPTATMKLCCSCYIYACLGEVRCQQQQQLTKDLSHLCTLICLLSLLKGGLSDWYIALDIDHQQRSTFVVFFVLLKRASCKWGKCISLDSLVCLQVRYKHQQQQQLCWVRRKAQQMWCWMARWRPWL